MCQVLGVTSQMSYVTFLLFFVVLQSGGAQSGGTSLKCGTEA